MSIARQLLEIKNKLPATVTLVAVSKTKAPALILEAHAVGQRHFGENYVQELVDKQAQLPADIHWHFIGHLQSNKIKYIAPFVYLIHGVDSLKLLQEINKQAAKNGRVIDCLLQVYIAQEETKFGLSFEEAEAILQSPSPASLEHIRIRGFMGMASNTANTAQVEKEFLSLKTFRDRLLPDHPLLEILSYGMSGDYPIAIACGSTLVRIGSTIFGTRSYPQ